MADWNALFRTDAFRDYRRRQVECVAEILNDQISATVNGNASAALDQIKGQMAMARTLIRLPEEIVKDEETREILDLQLVEDMANLTKFLLRKHINAEE